MLSEIGFQKLRIVCSSVLTKWGSVASTHHSEHKSNQFQNATGVSISEGNGVTHFTRPGCSGKMTLKHRHLFENSSNIDVVLKLALKLSVFGEHSPQIPTPV